MKETDELTLTRTDNGVGERSTHGIFADWGVRTALAFYHALQPAYLPVVTSVTVVDASGRGGTSTPRYERQDAGKMLSTQIHRSEGELHWGCTDTDATWRPGACR